MTETYKSFEWSLANFDPSLVADELLASLDIAEVNLALCGRSLPGAEGLDVPACLAKIDEWSEEVRQASPAAIIFGSSTSRISSTIRLANSTWPCYALRCNASAECATARSGPTIQVTPEILAIASSTGSRTGPAARAPAYQCFTSLSAVASVIRSESYKAQGISSCAGTRAHRTRLSLATGLTSRQRPTDLFRIPIASTKSGRSRIPIPTSILVTTCVSSLRARNWRASCVFAPSC